ncbi:DNA-protecting protein DprA [Streptomyces sp. NP160]|uniref:DNA-processing protein DprA n=1 Tax=Streptomyces sp. NP160 TaxID=2586637 RepID=UPI00111A7BE7|nr:DNA-processing protein DprA [Streptomyces sp. NP160]TNM62453.1 DNA-protecting protein DprA [Streptomyces sp. NP160]
MSAPTGRAAGWQDALPELGRRLPRWAGDERLAMLAWSRLAEPEDLVAKCFVAGRGGPQALERLASPAPVSAAECLPGETPDALRAGLARWASRWEETDPERDLARVLALGGRVVLDGDPEWPEGLVHLNGGEPFALWVRGPLDLAAACGRSAAVVGARAATAYGERIAASIAVGLGDAGATTVSGAALGIDGAAHRGALAAGAPTVAVLACGVDRAYPSSHQRLLRAVAEEGLVVSEVPPGSSPMRRRFLQRNRLIAAVSRATVVVEAGWRSGSLSTAGLAMDLCLPVGAVPGPVTSPSSEGCHRLLRSGAVCVTDAAEVLQLVDEVAPEPVRTVPARAHDGLDPVQVAVLDALPKVSARSAERIAVTAGLAAQDVPTVLRELSRRGLAARTSEGWRRAPLEPGGRAHPEWAGGPRP